MAHLDTERGLLRLVNLGHPLPLWWRAGQLQAWPEARPDRPFGLGHTRSTVHDVVLAPGDRVLLYTDGVVEAHAGDGVHFGDERLSAMFLDHAGAGLDPLDSLRAVVAAVIEHHRGDRLRDDATVVLVEWRGPSEGREHPGG